MTIGGGAAARPTTALCWDRAFDEWPRDADCHLQGKSADLDLGAAHVVGPGVYYRAIPDPEFSVNVTSEDSAELVAVHGDVDLATVDVLRAQLTAAIERAEKVVLDLREVSFMDTQGLAAVIEAEQASSATGTSFVVVRAPATVHRLFDMIGLSERLTVVDDPAAA